MADGNVKVIIGMGSTPKDVPVKMGDTVKSALQNASITVPPAKDIRVNGQPASLDYELMPGDQVSFLPKIEGGKR